jgi:hypothetical protein
MRRDVEVDGTHAKYPATFCAFEKAGIRLGLGSDSAQIVWWDGDIKQHDFELLNPGQRINKIPGMDYVCYKSTTIHALNQMRRMFPDAYRFFPHSFLLPHQFPDLQRAHAHLQGKTGQPVTWIVKPRNECCGHGIKLIQHISALTHKSDSVVVQKYISPFLIDGYKFDFRFYVLISSLAPYTVYIYREGLARFCTERYVPPAAANLDKRFGHLTNTSINKENLNATDAEFTKLATVVLEQILELEPTRSAGLWGKICDVTMLTLLGVWSSIVGSINHFNSERRLFARRPMRSSPELDSFSKYFHILGIDIMIAENLHPFVLELNDRPSMVVTYDCEAELKRDMIFDAFQHISVDGTPVDEPGGSSNWIKILPVNRSSPLASTVDEIISTTSSVFRTWAANKERPHYEERRGSLPRGKSEETFPEMQ